jgi:hypothetical protein
VRNEQCCFCDNAADIKFLFITRARAVINTALANQIQYSVERGVPSRSTEWGGGGGGGMSLRNRGSTRSLLPMAKSGHRCQDRQDTADVTDPFNFQRTARRYIPEDISIFIATVTLAGLYTYEMRYFIFREEHELIR